MVYEQGKRGTGSLRGQARDMRYSKLCLECGVVYYKYICCSLRRWGQSKFCSTPCKGAYLIKAEIAGRGFQHGHTPPTKGTGDKVPCKNCGAPILKCLAADYCRKAECRALAKAARYRKMGMTLAGMACRRGPGELALEPHMLARGWAVQYPVTVEGRTFLLDFAKPDAKLFVEADGAPHAIRRIKDAERTRLLVEDGWMGLRFWNSEIRDNLPGVLDAIWQ